MSNKIFPLFILVILASCKNKTDKNSQDQTTFETPNVVRKELKIDNNHITNLHIGCGYNKVPSIDYINYFPPSRRQLQQINYIMQYSGLPSNYEVLSVHGLENAVAFMNNNKRYIVFDPNLLNFVDQQSENYWSSMSILAHEIGHHLSNHTLSEKGSNIPSELEADKFSGFILYKMGASLEQAQHAMRLLSSEEETSTHPSKIERLKAIELGWIEANKLQFNAAIPPIPSDDNSFKDVEFTKENLHNLEDLVFRDHETELQEGIVLRRENNSSECDVLITKGESFDFLSANDDESIPVSIIIDDNPTDWLGYNFYTPLYHLLVPGRRIKFKVIVEGNGRAAFFSYVAHHSVKNSSRQNIKAPSSRKEKSNEYGSSFQVTSDKAYFHNTPDYNSRRNAHLVKGETGSFLSIQDDFVYIEFINVNNKKSKGWVLKSDLILF